MNYSVPIKYTYMLHSVRTPSGAAVSTTAAKTVRKNSAVPGPAVPARKFAANVPNSARLIVGLLAIPLFLSMAPGPSCNRSIFRQRTQVLFMIPVMASSYGAARTSVLMLSRAQSMRMETFVLTFSVA